jgi:hypothetical protein
MHRPQLMQFSVSTTAIFIYFLHGQVGSAGESQCSMSSIDVNGQ